MKNIGLFATLSFIIFFATIFAFVVSNLVTKYSKMFIRSDIKKFALWLLAIRAIIAECRIVVFDLLEVVYLIFLLFKKDIQIIYLRILCSHLTFKQSYMVAKNRRRAVFRNQLFNAIEEVHIITRNTLGVLSHFVNKIACFVKGIIPKFFFNFLLDGKL